MKEQVKDKRASIAQYLEMKAKSKALTLSDRLTPSLISAGLVKGIIPMWMRKKSDQLILDAVLKKRAGGNVEEQKAEK